MNEGKAFEESSAIAPAEQTPTQTGLEPASTLLDLSRPLTLVELSAWLRAPRSTLYKYLGEGLGEVGVKVGREWRFLVEDAWQWLKNRHRLRRLHAGPMTATRRTVQREIPPHLRLSLRSSRHVAGRQR